MKIKNPITICLLFLLTGALTLFAFFTLNISDIHPTITQQPPLTYIPAFSISLIVISLIGLILNDSPKNTTNPK